MFQKKRLLAGALALATCVNLVTVGAFARGESRSTSTQTSSAEETVYVNSYGGDSRQVDFSNHWRFNLGSGSEAVDYNDSAWRDVDLPHDYSIEQDYSASNEAESGYLPGGTGWYRKTFTLDEAWKDKVITVDFGGVYMNATVYLNGEKLGFHPYGYTAFSFELPQDLLKYDGENVLAVKVEHETPSSRWYSGSGIYRTVHLTVTEPVHVANNGTYVTTPDLKDNQTSPQVKVVTTVANDSKESATVSVKQTIYKNGSDAAVATIEGQSVTVEAGATQNVEQTTTVDSPELWSTKTPNLYTVKTEIVQDDKTVDTYTTEFGFRWTSFNNTNGFELNGVPTKLKGVCMHHDQGALGSEAWYRAIERQIDILKEMGCNAIRVTHNPAASELIEIANRKGMMIVDEAFDTWTLPKNGNVNDYSKWFNVEIAEGNQILGGEAGMTWAEFDIKAMVNQDKNAPAVIMYSLGNEIFEGVSGNYYNYPTIAQNLINWVKEVDESRPTTFGDNKLKDNWDIANQVAEVVAKNGGVVGYNYSTQDKLSNGMSKGWNVYHSETASAVNSRGVYDRKGSQTDKNGDKLLTSYDKSAVGWGAVASDAWWRVLQQDGSAGEFVWTGFDYIGEPTPWNGTGSGSSGSWPAPKSSYFGIIDTNGLPKDSYYLYQSQWNDKVTTLHLLPTWDEDDVQIDNGKVEVVVYSDAPVVKLYKDGVEIGSATSTEQGGTYKYRTFTSGTGCFQSASGHQSLYATFSVPYDGEKLEVKAFDAEGHEITETQGRSVVEKTSGAAKLTAQADRTSIVADGDDLSYITIDVKDKDGNLVNTDDVNVKLSIEGDGKIVGVDNGRQADHTSYQDTSRNVGAGQLVAIVQSTDKAGSFTVTATADGLTSDSVTVMTNAPEAGEGEGKTIVSYEISRYHYVKVGNKPQLPETVKVNYNDGTSDELKVTWNSYDEKLIEQVGSFAITGTLEGSNITVTVNITMLDQVAALLNYSTAVRVGGEVNLPASRPAVLADGTILNAEFPVEWSIPSDLTATTGVKEVKGTSQVFGEEMEVTASVRVAEGDVSIGGNVASSAHLSQSIPQDQQSDSLEAIINGSTEYVAGPGQDADGNTRPNPNVWTNYDWSQAVAGNDESYITFTYDTAQYLGQVELYFFVDSWSADLPKEVSFQWNLGSQETGWTDLKVTASEPEVVHDGDVDVYKVVYNFEPVSAVQLRVNLTNKEGGPASDRQYCVGLTEAKLFVVNESFPISDSADLTGITFNGKEWSASELAAHTYSTEALVVDSLKVDSGNNAAYTVLDAYNNVVKILTESEDHTNRGTYTIELGSTPSAGDPADDSRDYPRTKTEASAASYQSEDLAPSKVVDGNTGTHWHTSWSGGNLSNNPEKRYIQLTLEEATMLDALRYLPRQGNADGEANGRVTGYRVEVSMTGEDGSWTTVSQGTWANNIDWKIAVFDQPTQAKYVRLYGVTTVSNQAANAFMSGAEVRVRMAETKTDLSSATVTLEKDSYEYTGKAIEPKPTVVLDGKTLKYGVDYVVDYKDNVAPGEATLTVRGIVDYSGTVTKTFTIEAADLVVDQVETVSVVTSQGDKPTLPSTVKVTFTDGSALDCAVAWDEVSDEQVAEVGNVFTVNGTVSLPNDKTTATTATVRVITQNLALAQEGSTLPLAVSFYSPASDSAVNINDGSKTFDVSSDKKVWSDWESGKYHEAPWVAIILKEATTVDRVSIGFIDETGVAGGDVQADHSVRLPASYEIQVYTGTDELDYKTDNVNDGQNWPVMNNNDNWTTVATVTELPDAKNFDQMLVTTFEGVKTTAVRVVMTPQDQQWVGVDELEIFGSGEKPLHNDFTVESITADGVNVLDQADENNHITLTVEEDAAMPVLAATATNNAKVVVTPAADFNGQARIVITSEDGSKTVTYTVSFQVKTEPEPTPTVAPTAQPTVAPTAQPTDKPEPTAQPTAEPTTEPTAQPTDKPGESPAPTQAPNPTDKPGEGGNTQTGDTANLTPVVVVLVVAAVALVAVVVFARKHNKH